MGKVVIDFNKLTKNKYDLTISKIKDLKVGNREKVKEPLFWRNNGIEAWCIYYAIGPEMCNESFWIGIYDETAKKKACLFEFMFTTYGGMCGYVFDEFYREEDIENDMDLQIQSKFLEKINDLIDNGVLVF